MHGLLFVPPAQGLDGMLDRGFYDYIDVLIHWDSESRHPFLAM